MKKSKNYGLWNSISFKLYELRESYKRKPEKVISTRSMPGILLLVLLFYFGLAIFTRGAMLYYLGTSSEGWIQTEGIVLSSKISEDDSDTETLYSLDLVYEYKIDGRTYKSNTVSYNDLSTENYHQVEAEYNRFPKGSVIVYYDSEKPENAVLSPGVTIGSHVFLLFGLLMMAGALLAYLFPTHFTISSQNR
ncbi:MAG: DUF3592 domain-containing protein [Calditrichia bacterium]